MEEGDEAEEAVTMHHRTIVAKIAVEIRLAGDRDDHPSFAINVVVGDMLRMYVQASQGDRVAREAEDDSTIVGDAQEAEAMSVKFGTLGWQLTAIQMVHRPRMHHLHSSRKTDTAPAWSIR